MTNAKKLAKAKRWLRARGKGLLQVKHTRERHQQMQKALEPPVKLRRIV